MWHREHVDRRDLGAWSFELRDDEIADLAYRGHPVLRSVRAVVRDHDWNTAAWTTIDTDAAGHGAADPDAADTVTLHLHTDALGADITGSVRIAASGGELTVTFDAVSATAFDTNRTGLVVLHPPQVAGAALTVAHSDGRVAETAFPREISPHQPVFDITALAWESDDALIETRFEGDVFEMEDQRNWTDASFKTYSRPLALPFPYRLDAGAHVTQTLTVRATLPKPRTDAGTITPGATDAGTRIAADAIPTIELLPGGAFPRIGLGAASAPDPAPAFAPIGQEVLVELDLASPNWPAALHRAQAAGLPLDVRFVLDADAPERLDEGARALQGLDVVRVAAFHQVSDARHVSDVEATEALRGALRAADVTTTVVGGSRSHFTELNRERHRLPADLEGLVVSTTPLFHALGTEQLVEAVAMQRLIALQSVSYAGILPVHIGPVCLRPRFNDVATAPQPLPTRSDLADGYGAQFAGDDDPRQRAPELAAWTIASAAALAVPGVESLSWFEEWGPRGIRTLDGEALPVADALVALAALADLFSPDGELDTSHALTPELVWGDSPDGLLWAIGARTPDGITALVANLDRTARTVNIDLPGEVGDTSRATRITAECPASAFIRIDTRSSEDTP